MTKIGVFQSGVGWSYNELRDYWVEADRLGFDSAWMMDNVVYPHPVTHEMLDVFETWTVLPALAEATKKIRMGPLVTPCRRRHPALLAKITTTFDRISNGRLDLGLGPGDDPVYFRPWGMTYPRASIRIQALREEIEVLRRMWTQKEANFQGKYYTLTNATNDPKPFQKPHPPIWIGLVLGKRVMPRVAAELGDAINVWNGSDVAAQELLVAVEKRCKQIGRDFESIAKSRHVDVVFSDGGPGFAHHSLKDLFESPEQALEERSATLDQQIARMKVAKDATKSEYVRVTTRFAFGNPDEIAADLRKIAASGFDHLIVTGLETIDDLRRFAEQVMPEVRR